MCSLLSIPADVFREHILTCIFDIHKSYNINYEVYKAALSMSQTCKRFRIILNINPILFKFVNYKSLKLVKQSTLLPYFIWYVANILCYKRQNIVENYIIFAAEHANIDFLHVLSQAPRTGLVCFRFPGAAINLLIARNNLDVAIWICKIMPSNICRFLIKLCKKACQLNADIALAYFIGRCSEQKIILNIDNLITIAHSQETYRILYNYKSLNI
jgi:hypothetical protein